MRSPLPLLALTLTCSVLGACSSRAESADDRSLSTASAEERAQADDRACLFPMVTSVIRRAPLFMIDATKITRAEVFWWHGVPQPSSDDPTMSFAIDRHAEDADGIHYVGHELAATDTGRVIDIELPRRPQGFSIGTVKVSAPGLADETIDLRTNEPCSDL